ncbi:4-hydroxythreonine-4-phosphate dehydrogenase [Candidatus Photodesmus katoptron]|uniref:4-hydroxythreonine-4-phosphate dehydrogenase n=1 Tax=Candidatus Photodesmus katoptron Akat1 TaxID=1236703 RepID=S3DFW8_9GAMM|nr:4-hydroxythreonine-4-phosphate dehydrogenase PdxA [Candidatus Photodesmus katoptron]EPE37272.1 4-hydroxythreonine-4-phosphate dehydrogenase [Candidatus Photodesmus katoptron Akat1]KEY90071.1 4-hydroxythreonine-4-phosphate dehydrogenase [Candidatus Photodesmus katoptron]
MSIKRIIITSGEPAGIGPDLALFLSTENWSHQLIICADKTLLSKRAQLLGIDVNLINYESNMKPIMQKAGSLIVDHIPLNDIVIAGKINPNNSCYVLNILEKAILGCMNNEFDAIVTCPVHKGAINRSGFSFSGHTEFLAEKSNTSLVVMMLSTKGLKVALATTHIPLSQVSKTLTKDKLEKTIRLLNRELIKKFRIKSPSIYVCGLNPHAGENGFLGREEVEMIIPTLEKIRQKYAINLIGPLPADTIFNDKYLKKADVILGMYHDQVLPVLKYKGFSRSVNITLGLPFIRTSVDHGTALEFAGKRKAINIKSLRTAIKYAVNLGENHLKI